MRGVSPIYESVGAIRWSLFSGLSFRRESTSQAQAARMVFAYTRSLADYFGVHYRKLIWCIRAELGERTARKHLHVLIGGAPEAKVTDRACLASKAIWFKIGHGDPKQPKRGPHSSCRIFDPSLAGVDYLLKGLEQAYSLQGANLYELRKFAFGPTDVTLSESLIHVVMLGRSIAKTRQLASTQSGVRALAPERTGLSLGSVPSPVRSAVESSERVVGVRPEGNCSTVCPWIRLITSL